MSSKEFNQQIESIKDSLLTRFGPALSITEIGREPAMPSQKTIRNLKSLKQIPEDVFFRGPSGILVDTKRFLEWWSSRCSKA